MIRLLQGDCREVLKTLPGNSVQCCVTSPPYYGLRDYGVAGQIGLEASPDEYVATLVEVFREVRRVLRDDGVLWLNLGDSYGRGERTRWSGDGKRGRNLHESVTIADSYGKSSAILPNKQLLMMPARVALALQADGWVLRSQMPWIKRSCMPESVTDRPTTAIEYVFLFAKSANYFWDAQAVARQSSTGDVRRPFAPGQIDYRGNGHDRRDEKPLRDGDGSSRNFRNSDLFFDSLEPPHGLICDDDGNPLALDVNPQPFSEAHFATFPAKLITPLIQAATSERGCCANCGAPLVRNVSISYDNPGNRTTNGPRSLERRHETAGFAVRLEKRAETTGWLPSCECNAETRPCTVLDPFGGAGTSGLVADRLGRDAILIDLNGDYVAMARNRIADDAGMFAMMAAE